MKWITLFLIITLHLGATQIEEQRSSFQQKGYLWIKNFFSKEQVPLLQSWTEKIHSDARAILSLSESVRPSPSLIVVPEATHPNQVCRAEDMLSFYPDLYHLVEGSVTAYLSFLLKEKYVLFKDKLNFKWPGGGAFAPHQDFPAFEFFGPREHITAMVCIDAPTVENGCLYVANEWSEESHEILPYIEGGNLHGSIQPAYAQELTWLPLLVQPGDLVLFTSFVPHYSDINQSDGPRRAMFFTLNKLSEGEHRSAYYHTKREDPLNPLFHFATPINARIK